jgi:hypothetical protein
VFVLKAKLPPKAAMANLLDEVEGGGGTKQQIFFENEKSNYLYFLLAFLKI